MLFNFSFDLTAFINILKFSKIILLIISSAHNKYSLTEMTIFGCFVHLAYR